MHRLVLAALLLPGAALAQAPAPVYRAGGNEPFWSLRIEGDAARLDRLGQPLQETMLGPPRVEGGVTRREGVAIAITISPGPCRDSMTGVEMPDRVRVEAGEARLDGCGGSAEARLLGAWRIETIGGRAVAAARPPTLEFGPGGAISGQGPCNRYRGSWAMEGERLVIRGVASTMMACPEPAMAQEAALFRLLETVRAHRFTEDGALSIEGEDGTTLVARRG